MAYGNYFPMNYQPNYYGNPYQQVQQMQQQQSPQQTQPQIQQNGFVPVRSIAEVEAYPIAPGNSIAFFVEGNPPIIATKTKGFSQLENPVTKYFDLTERRVMAQSAPESSNNDAEEKDSVYALKSDLAALWSEINAIKESAAKKPAKKKVAEVVSDDDE